MHFLYRCAVAFAQDDFARSINGGAVGTDTSGAWPAATITQGGIGCASDGGNALNGRVGRFTAPVRRVLGGTSVT